MKFKTEDDAFEYYLEQCQMECGFDITESDRAYTSVVDSFLDWAEDEEITWEE